MKRLKLSNPKGNRKPKVNCVKAGGNHLMTRKSPSATRRIRSQKKIMSANAVKRYHHVITGL